MAGFTPPVDSCRVADSIILQVTGVDQAIKTLSDLNLDLQRKTIRQALRTAARPMVTLAKSLAPVLKKPDKRASAGTLRRNIRVFNSKKFSGSGGVIGVYVTVLATRADLKRAPVSGDPFYFRWVEAGHAFVPRARRAARHSAMLNSIAIQQRQPGGGRFVPAQPFLGPAFEGARASALEIFQSVLIARIAKAQAGAK